MAAAGREAVPSRSRLGNIRKHALAAAFPNPDGVIALSSKQVKNGKKRSEPPKHVLSKPQSGPVTPLSTVQKTSIRETLDRVLASPAFRKSEQCQKFLRFVVEHSIISEDELLRERNIGIEVFGRAPDYDTADDPVVRVRATEVRKRLAQYYGEAAETGDVRFEIPAGSYRVEFHWPGVVSVSRPRKVSSRIVPGAVLLIAVAVAGFGIFISRKDALDRFWAPVLSSPKPVFLYCGRPVVYFLSRDVHERFRQSTPDALRPGSYAVSLDPNEVLHGRDIVPVTDQFVGIGNAHTAATLSAMFAARKKPVEIRYADDLSFSDLRSAPSVLIGAFSNLWTLEMQAQLRFVFEQENGVRRIRDKSGNRTWQLSQLGPDGKTPEDYALVSRRFDSGTGQIFITAAGITQYGTRAAGEFLASATLLDAALANQPEWWRKNVQVLLHTSVIRGTPATPTVISAQVW